MIRRLRTFLLGLGAGVASRVTDIVSILEDDGDDDEVGKAKIVVCKCGYLRVY